MKVVVLAGGSGTRLFPISRKNYPKQFLKIDSSRSLFQKTIERSLLIVDLKNLIVVANKDYQFHIRSQISELLADSVGQWNLILEPVGRNTAPAIALAVKFALEKLKTRKDEVLFVTPSDHVIFPDEKFAERVKEAEGLAKRGYVVTFGIEPTKPEQGYGYIESYKVSIDENIVAYKVKKFHEKPDLETAKEYLRRGYYWNSGMFAFTIETILDEFRKYVPEIYENIKRKTFEEILDDFESMPDISIDYAVMEKTNNAVVLPLDLTWSDMGSWDAFYELMDKDSNGNVKLGNIVDIETRNSFILSNKRLISTIGVDDLIVVDSDDVLLIVKRGESQKVKDIVKKLQKNGKFKYLTEFHTTVCRPWGRYVELEKGDRYKIKRIVVEPGEALSLQLHHHRSEHWIVIKGTAKVVLENKNGELEEFFVHENESIYVPKSRKHRIINPGKIPLEIIEVQVGEYVEENDIVRFEDKYNRQSTGGKI